MPIRIYSLILLMCSMAASAQTATPDLSQRVSTLLNARLAQTKCPGLAIAVAQGNRIVVSQALGLADLEQHVPMRTDSVNRLGSLSKPITGTIIMGLVEEGNSRSIHR